MVHETGELLGNKIGDAVTNSYDDKTAETEEEIIIPPEKREILNELNKTSIIKMTHYKISKLLNYLFVSKYVTKKNNRSKWFIKQSIFSQKNIRFRTSILRSDLCNHSDAYIIVKGIIMTATEIEPRTT